VTRDANLVQPSCWLGRFQPCGELLEPKLTKCSLFEQGVNLAGVRAQGEISFSGSTISGDLDLGSAQIGGNANFDGTSFLKKIDLHYAQIGHQLIVDNARIVGEVDMKGIQIGSRATFKSGNYLGQIDLDNAKIGDTLDFSASHLYASLDLSQIQVGNAVYLGTHQSSDTNYLESPPRNDGTVSVFDNVIDFERAKIGLKLWLARGIFHKKVYLVGSKIDGDLNLGLTDKTWAKRGKGRGT
jgi:hypothetical protein